MLYRIYTEDVNRDEVEQLISSKLDSFTLLTGIGYYKGEKEQCLIVEIISDNPIISLKVKRLAEQIKKLNKQHSVLVQQLQNSAYSV